MAMRMKESRRETTKCRSQLDMMPDYRKFYKGFGEGNERKSFWTSDPVNRKYRE